MAEYRHWAPAAPRDPVDKHEFLVTRLEDLKMLLDNGPNIMAVDTETTGFDPEKDEIVGFSVAFTSSSGFYVPLRHKVCAERNVPAREALDLLYAKMRSCELVLFYNARFDMRMIVFDKFSADDPQDIVALQKAPGGYDFDCVKYLDVMAVMFLMDTNWILPSLKDCLKYYLGYSLPSFEDTVSLHDLREITGETRKKKIVVTFDLLPPVDAYVYASRDAWGTFELWERFFPVINAECGLVLHLESEMARAVMNFEAEKTRIDYKTLETYRDEVEERVEEIQHTVNSIAGYEININSPKQLARLFSTLGLDTGVRTKTGDMSTKKDYVEALDHPVAKFLVEKSEKAKMLSSYVKPLLSTRKAGNNRFSYKTYAVNTGRFAGSSEKENGYFVKMNIQAVTKPMPADYYFCPEGAVARTPDYSVAGYDFFLKGDEDLGLPICEGKDPRYNIRKCFLPEDGHYHVSVDFESQELKIAANYCGEDSWVQTFLSGGDLHKATAIAVFGEENYDSYKRKLAKVINFGVLYGRGPKGLAENLGVTIDEAKDFLNAYWKGNPKLYRWVQKVRREGQTQGTVYNDFGRPRRLRAYHACGDRAMSAFADRSAANTVIQGLAGDVMRVALLNLSKYLQENPDVRWKSMVHDECNFSVPKARIHEVAAKIQELMQIQREHWAVPLTTSVDIGASWGTVFKFEHGENGYYKPVES